MEEVKNFTNITGADFTGMIHGEKKVIPAGKTVALPQKIANHFAGQLVTKILMKKRENYLEEPLRKPLLDKILGDVVAPAEKEKEEKEEKTKPLKDFTVKELKKLAAEKKIDVKGLKKKEDLIEAIEATEEATEEEGEEGEEEAGEEEEFPGVKD